MSRRWLPWLLALPLMVGGSVAAHELAYWIVTPDTSARAELLASTGHGYFEHGPLVFGVLGAVLLAAFGARTVSSVTGRGEGLVSAWWFFALPLIAFAVQEHLERLLHSGHLPLAAVLEPTFVVGLALQVPFGLAALALARIIFACADELADSLPPPPRPRSTRPLTIPLPVASFALPRISAIALGRSERGPPVPSR